jgi:4-aminobutyrate aminotransferase-like enzyme
MAPTIDLRTELPGPRSTEILARKQRVIADAKSIYLPIVIDHAHGVAVTDVDGNTFLDWTGGIGCLNVGHTNEAVSAALHAQVDRFLHTDFTMVPYESYIELAERLLAKTPIAGPKKAAFFNSGAEAVENAIKIAKLATGRPAVICFDRAFHGRTLMAMSLTSKQHPYKAGLGPFAPEVYRAPYPYPYRDESADPAAAALAALRGMFSTHVAAELVAILGVAVIGDHLGAVTAGGVQLGRRRVLRHQDHRRHVEHRGRYCDRLGVVAGRVRGDAPGALL